MFRFLKYLLGLVLIIVIHSLYSQNISLDREIHWRPDIIDSSCPEKTHILNFVEGVYENPENRLPFYNELIKISEQTTDIEVYIDNAKFIPLYTKRSQNINLPENITEKIDVDHKIGYIRKKPYAQISFLPLRKNPASGVYEKLISFRINIIERSYPRKTIYRREYADNSVLNSGDWVKIAVTQDGVYKISWSELVNMGFNDPQNVRVFGYGGGMLPEINNISRHDDLIENAIWLEKGSDGIFNEGDYLLFYGQGPVQWCYDENNRLFTHKLHLYSDSSFYFITVNNGSSKLITTESTVPEPATHYVNSFIDHKFHETQSKNLIKSGQLWVGESFDIQNSQNFGFVFPNLDTDSPGTLKTNVIARASLPSSFYINVNDLDHDTISMSAIDMGSYVYASSVVSTADISPVSDNINVNINYNKSTSIAEAWLNYILINVRCHLVMRDDQMVFRDTSCIDNDAVTSFSLAGSGSGTAIWDITDPANVKKIETSYLDDTLTFKVATDSLREFIAFTGSSFLAPSVVGKVENQNLHGLGFADMIIISHKDFIQYANQLADMHRNDDGLDVIVIDPEVIYNEFSSGSRDVSALRDFVKMFYDKAGDDEEKMPDYLLLFGDGSYDNKTSSINNTNFILTYQSASSLSSTESFVTDDFFGLLDHNEGGPNGLLDIGIGRLPVKSGSEAQTLLDKIINYKSVNALGDWRNILCFIADDEDNNGHLINSNYLTTVVDTAYNIFNIKKIYLDAYPQITSSSGDSYPGVNQAIYKRVDQGALIVDYTGHGGEMHFAHEHVLTMNEVKTWENYNKLPFFITASCDIGRFDDYSRTTLGEYFVLHTEGGGIATLTTTRLVYAGANFILSQQFYNHVFEKDNNNEYLRLGDIIRLTKINAGGNYNKRNFTLLGDPALRLAYPKNNIITSSVNHTDISSVPDTLQALSMVNITGYIADNNGDKLTDYNGILYPSFYDKRYVISTLGNDGGNTINFWTQDNIFYKAKASITNGEFDFSFIVPKDIAYNYGYGKISYYAENSIDGKTDDASGYNKNIIVGGIDTTVTDNQGPEIQLFMNDSAFVFGGITDENPKLIAVITDSSGINITGNGIGHDITAILDNETANTLILNNYYEPEINSYQGGRIEYIFNDLGNGVHDIKLRAWDVFNNSSEEYVEFIVSRTSELVVDRVYNYPNPFTTRTSFYFVHNQPNTDLDILIRIFTITGKLIKTIETTAFPGSSLGGPVEWDGLDNYGDRIGKGVYLYSMKIRSPNGNTVNKIEKLLILK